MGGTAIETGDWHSNYKKGVAQQLRPEIGTAIETEDWHNNWDGGLAHIRAGLAEFPRKAAEKKNHNFRTKVAHYLGGAYSAQAI